MQVDYPADLADSRSMKLSARKRICLAIYEAVRKQA
jgi:hypothetical protein